MNEEIIYTTPDEMFRVIRKDGLYFPQERICSCYEYQTARITDMKLYQELRDNNWNVSLSDWKSFFLGYVGNPRNQQKSYKVYKTAKGAIAFADNQSAYYQEAA